MAEAWALLQVVQQIWDGFRREFAQQWTEAVADGRGGDLALDALYGPKAPAGSASLQVRCPCWTLHMGHNGQLLSASRVRRSCLGSGSACPLLARSAA